MTTPEPRVFANSESVAVYYDIPRIDLTTMDIRVHGQQITVLYQLLDDPWMNYLNEDNEYYPDTLAGPQPRLRERPKPSFEIKCSLAEVVTRDNITAEYRSGCLRLSVRRPNIPAKGFKVHIQSA